MKSTSFWFWSTLKDVLFSVCEVSLIRYTLEENKINKNFKIGQRLHTKHHQIDQKHDNLINLLMFGMQFLTNFKTSILYLFLKAIANKIN